MALQVSAQIEISNQRCEYMPTPIGIDSSTPRLTWEIVGTDPLSATWVEITDHSTGATVWKSEKLPADIRRVTPKLQLDKTKRYDWTVTAQYGNNKRAKSES